MSRTSDFANRIAKEIKAKYLFVTGNDDFVDALAGSGRQVDSHTRDPIAFLRLNKGKKYDLVVLNDDYELIHIRDEVIEGLCTTRPGGSVIVGHIDVPGVFDVVNNALRERGNFYWEMEEGVAIAIFLPDETEKVELVGEVVLEETEVENDGKNRED